LVHAQSLLLHGGASALSAPRVAAAAPGDAADAEPFFEYDFLLAPEECAAAAAAAVAACEDGPEAVGAPPATLCDDAGDDPRALSAAAHALLGRFGAGDRVLLSLAPPLGGAAADVSVLGRATLTAVAPPPPGATAGGALLTLRSRRALRVPGHLDGVAGAWRIDRDDGAGLVTKMRGTLWAMVMQPGPCRLRDLVAELAPPRPREPAPAPRPDAPGAAAAAALCGSLNTEQRAALDAVLRASDFVLLRGLPGTGKTATLVAAVAALVARGASVLLACHTHSALDNALARLLRAGVPGVLRLSNDPSRVAPEVRCACLGSAAWPAANAEGVAACASAARIVGVTCHGAGSAPALQRRRFHVAVLDEAAQVPLPLALATLSRADAFLLVGDPAQLPPLWASPVARAAGGEESLFARLAAAHPGAVTQLCCQYRMAADVQLLANELVYDGALRCGSEATATRTLTLPRALPAGTPAWMATALAPGARVVLCDTDALRGAAAEARHPLRNPGEAALAAALAAAALGAGAPPGTLVLMTPYNAQVTAMGAACAALRLPPGAVEATTVDRAQGRDLPAVVLSCVRTAGDAGAAAGDAPGGGSLLDDARRLCVALTRAQGKLIILASLTQLRAAPLTARLAALCEQRGWLLRLPPDALAGAPAGGGGA
jgi:DNA replication ATP-dependent helicase Dna2